MSCWHKMICCVLFIVIFVAAVECKKRKPQKQSTDTSVFNFVRLFVFRLIYGFASMFGAEEGLSDFMDGIFVPPGAENSDYINEGDEDDY